MNVPKHVVQAVNESLRLLPPAMGSKEARAMLYAIGLQESRFTHRAQVIDGGGKGPARGYWQFERGGGVTGVLRHPASRFWMNSACNARNVPAQPMNVWLALETDDVLAAAAAAFHRAGWRFLVCARRRRAGRAAAGHAPALTAAIQM